MYVYLYIIRKKANDFAKQIEEKKIVVYIDCNVERSDMSPKNRR